jgi:hypothetical protein
MWAHSNDEVNADVPSFRHVPSKADFAHGGSGRLKCTFRVRRLSLRSAAVRRLRNIALPANAMLLSPSLLRNHLTYHSTKHRELSCFFQSPSRVVLDETL